MAKKVAKKKVDPKIKKVGPKSDHSDMVVGFEFEMLTPYTRAQMIERFIADLEINLAQQNHGVRQRNQYANWNITNDGSIHGISGHGHEVVSPPMPYAEAMEVLEDVFGWMAQHNALTNASTGLHVGISFATKSRINKLNKVVLSSILDELAVLRKFGRTSNQYCARSQPQLNSRIQNASNSAVYNLMHTASKKTKEKITTEKILKGTYMGGKYQFVNYDKVSQKYLEFRGMGGYMYHTKLIAVKESIEHFADCMKASLDVDKIPDEVEAMVKQTLKRAKDDYTRQAKSDMAHYEKALAERRDRIARLQQFLVD